MSHLSVFFNTRLENLDGFGGALVGAGDLGLMPFRYLFGGRDVKMVYTSYNPASKVKTERKPDFSQSFESRGVAGGFIAVLFLIPGIVLSIFKVLGYLFSSEARQLHALAARNAELSPKPSTHSEQASRANPPTDLKKVSLKGYCIDSRKNIHGHITDVGSLSSAIRQYGVRLQNVLRRQDFQPYYLDIQASENFNIQPTDLFTGIPAGYPPQYILLRGISCDPGAYRETQDGRTLVVTQVSSDKGALTDVTRYDLNRFLPIYTIVPERRGHSSRAKPDTQAAQHPSTPPPSYSRPPASRGYNGGDGDDFS